MDEAESEVGSIPFTVEDGMIVSTAELGSPNGYLSTIKEYSNFILEWEVKIDTTLNSRGADTRTGLGKRHCYHISFR